MAQLHPASSRGHDGDWTEIGADLIESLRADLAEERNRKSSLETRSLSAASASAAAVALLLGLGGQYSGRWQILFFVVLLAGSLAFLAAAYFGWRTAKVGDYREMALAEYQDVLDKGWDEGQGSFRRFIADGLLDVLRDARQRNNAKADSNAKALFFLVLGGSCVAFEIGLVLVDHIL